MNAGLAACVFLCPIAAAIAQPTCPASDSARALVDAWAASAGDPEASLRCLVGSAHASNDLAIEAARLIVAERLDSAKERAFDAAFALAALGRTDGRAISILFQLGYWARAKGRVADADKAFSRILEVRENDGPANPKCATARDCPKGTACVLGRCGPNAPALNCDATSCPKSQICAQNACKPAEQAPPFKFDLARYEKAALDAAAGRTEEALKSFRQLTKQNPAATQSVTQIVKLLSKADGSDEALAFCSELLRSGRQLQAGACAQALLDVPKAGQLRRRIYGNQAKLTVQEVRDLQQRDPDLARATRLQIDACTQGRGLATVINWRDSEIGIYLEGDPEWGRQRAWHAERADQGIYARLAEGVSEPRIRRCFATCAATSCLEDLRVSGPCADVRSISRYVDAILSAPSDKATPPGLVLRPFLDAVFDTKGILYADTDKNRDALFQLHLQLARIFSTIGNGDRFYERVDYHVTRARDLWRGGRKAAPFPTALLPAGKCSDPQLIRSQDDLGACMKQCEAFATARSKECSTATCSEQVQRDVGRCRNICSGRSNLAVGSGCWMGTASR
jgi:tetratricopeptide (TPR) repeat protein